MTSLVKVIPLALLLLGCATTSAACRKCRNEAILVGAFNAADSAAVRKKFDARVDSGKKEIFFRIDSTGGEVEEGLALAQHVRDAKKRHHLTIKCLAYHKAYSMGFYFMQLACDERLAAYGSLLMAHGVAEDIQDHKKIDEIKTTLSYFEAENDMLFGMSAHRMHITKAQFIAEAEHHDWYLSPDEALALGAIDRIVDPDDYPLPPEDLITFTVEDIIMTYTPATWH